MKNFLYTLFGGALLLTPAFVLASLPPPGDADVSASAEVNAQVQVGGVPPKPTSETRLPKVAPQDAEHPLFPSPENIRKLASTTAAGERPGLKPLLLNRDTVLKMMTGTSSPEQRKQMREDSRDALEAKKAAIASTTEAARARAQVKFGEAVQTSVGNITNMLTRAGEKLVEIANRIDARITEKQGQGADMTTSAALLVQARADIATAQDKITAVGTALTAALSSATPKTEVTKVRAAVKAAEDALHTAKDSLQKTLESMRVEGQASGSAQVQTQPTI